MPSNSNLLSSLRLYSFPFPFLLLFKYSPSYANFPFNSLYCLPFPFLSPLKYSPSNINILFIK